MNTEDFMVGMALDLSRTEIEQLARERAERLLSPAARAQANEPERPAARLPEPTLEERLAAIDRRWLAWAAEIKAGILGDQLEIARKRFAQAVAVTRDEQVRQAHGLVQRVERLT
jgi:hypothetical protein